MDKIQTITVLIPLICTTLALDATNTNKAYLTFYCMLSSTYIDLLSPVFKSDAQIDNIFNRTLELLMLHEGLYPIQEAMICWHQLLDLVQLIKKFGPLNVGGNLMVNDPCQV